MNKLAISLIISALLPFNAIANSCKIEGYTVSFFNGVATTKDQAKNGQDKIESTLGISQYNSEPVEYQLFYNDSYVESNGFNVLADFAETFDQRTQELEQRQFDRWEAFWDIVNGKQDSSIIKKISAAFSWFGGFVTDFISQNTNVVIREFLELLTLSVDSPDTAKTQMQHKLINDSNTWKGKKLIYIAHSQGNLWVNKSYNYIVSQLGYDASNIHVIHIAPASPTLSFNSDYILSTSDLVINGLNFTGIGSVQPPNTVIAPSSSDAAGHGLIEIYLTHPKSIEKIKSSVDKAFASLAKPDMEDVLFSIDYNYTDNFKIGHEQPQYDFVDSKKNRIYDPYDYLKSDRFRYNLKPDPIVETNTLLFSLDKKNDTINITSCDNSEYSLGEGGIPNTESFVFADFSNIKKLAGPLDMKVSKIVTDRYGHKWENIKIDVSPNYIGGLAGSYGNGSLIEFFVTQDHYSDEQKTILKRLNLSGKYQVEARLIENYIIPH
ncbi:TPA: hypothetical protein ACX6Q4_002567 [Photobacterium damselae]|uniref:hypothetical protein n=1 Tax=Photobacterium damselae TaxID=38293 RepID=UPI0030F3FE3D